MTRPKGGGWWARGPNDLLLAQQSSLGYPDKRNRRKEYVEDEGEEESDRQRDGLNTATI
jgi:hypothetical protein